LQNFSNTNGSGNAGSLFISSPLLSMDGGRILTRTLGDGNAGDIEIKTGRLTLTGGAQIFSGIGDFEAGAVQGTQGPGRGGHVTVRATDSISIAGHDSEGFQSGLFSSAQIGKGAAGNISVKSPTLIMQDSGTIAADTSDTSSGNAGNIDVQVGRLALTGGAQISSATEGVGRGGNVSVATTERLELSNRGTISASSAGIGNAGDIVIQAGQIFRSRNGAVTTEAETADGGNITLLAGSRVELRDSQITATVQSGVGKGGNITFDPQFIVLQRSQVRADAFGGPGGNVHLIAEVFLADPLSQVSASSALGINGIVNIQAPVTSISGAVAPLPQAFAQTAELLRSRCAERLREGTVSRFVIGGRDGVPLEPGSLLQSPLIREEQPGPAPLAEPVAGQREASFGPAGGLERPNTASRSLRGAQAQAPRREMLDMDCARWRGMQGIDVKTVP
jgi:large exoprotein involved in heme utilization and adhesion